MDDRSLAKLAIGGAVGFGAVVLVYALSSKDRQKGESNTLAPDFALPNPAEIESIEPVPLAGVLDHHSVEIFSEPPAASPVAPSFPVAVVGPSFPAAAAFPIVPTSNGGSSTAVQTLNGSMVAIFALEGYHKGLRLAMYSLRIANHSSAALICRIWIVSHEGAASLAYPVSFEIEPFAVKSTEVPVWLDGRRSFKRAVAEIAGEGVHCLVDADAPIIGQRPRPYLAIAAACVIAALLTLATAAFETAVPRIAAFAAPPMALTGTTVQAEYATSGAGTLSYVVTAPDGRRVQGGTLGDRSGAIPVAIPVSSDSGAYVLQLTMQGPLGNAKEMRVLNSVVPKSRGGAQISDISVNPVVAKPGQTIEVAYAASADDGYVRLVGTDGTVWAQKPFSRNGLTAFAVPAVVDSREMRVLLRVTKGRSAAESSAGLVVATADKASAANAAHASQAASDADSGAADPSGANGTFDVATRTIKSGGAIHVRILSPRNGMRISLTDPQSHEVTGVNVGADQATVALRAPNVQLATRYTVVASFTDGFGQESIVQPVTVMP